MAINVCQKLKQRFCPECNNDRTDGCRNCWVEAICDLIEIAETDRWIPVCEKLPPKNDAVLVYCKNKTIQGGATRHIGSCDNGFWFLKTQPGTESFPHCEWEVTHWMPLPEPPKGE